jgi:hypothetical protein
VIHEIRHWARGCAPRAARTAAALIAVNSLFACSGITPAKGRPTEFRSDTAPRVNYKTIVVIAADDNKNALRMSASVRTQLNKDGFKAVRRAGHWTSEEDAMNEVCRAGQPERVDGLLIVSFDALLLRECTSKLTAYKVNGGGRLGIQEMTFKLENYFRSMATIPAQ